MGQVLACQLPHDFVCKFRSRYPTCCLMPTSAARNYLFRVVLQDRFLAELDFWIANPRAIAPN